MPFEKHKLIMDANLKPKLSWPDEFSTSIAHGGKNVIEVINTIVTEQY